MTTYTVQFTWTKDRDALKEQVRLAEAAAVVALGGPVTKTNRFINGTRDFELTWVRADA